MIGFDGRTLGVPNPGGPARVGRELLGQLGTLENGLIVFGHESVASRYEVPFDSTGFYWNSRPYGIVWEQIILPQRARANEVDIMYSPNSLLPVVWKGTPFVVTIHDVASLSGYSSGWYRRYERAKLPIVARRADKIVTVSEFSKGEIVDKLHVSPEKVAVVYNGVSDVFRDDAPGQPIDLPEKYILYVGDTSKRKNIDGVLRAFSAWRQSSDLDHELVLIGPSDSPTVVDVSVSENPRVRNVGYVSDAELKYAYDNSAVFLFPSRYEGFGISPLEAMSCGTPVITANTSSLPEVLGNAARYVDPEDHSVIANAIERVLRDDNLAAELRKRGYERASSYTWERSAEKLRTVLTDVAGQ